MGDLANGPPYHATAACQRIPFEPVNSKGIKALEADNSKKGILKQVRKILGIMETNLKHPSLNTHKYDGISCKFGDVFESYAQNKTPGAYRVFWVYGPRKREIYILDITPHP